ncbi:hypothetical protein M427DRAFT_154651 [Gonapodya prolifera JEL478]|uniref:GST N-terminal domain-containing protein n=1 Tax=Gonapodya prolifera (strain JEL478) TaxID=1344416 RepID=A0A139AHU1_GONPJ|nr:hypothetical protein M427DRAFT_154651 [Gonapodya prolifera JEL478]|eukprot:KXS16330.1 hypothetical protein M427DRAFT_154651 [Gonapodya prolifera JEL478]
MSLTDHLLYDSSLPTPNPRRVHIFLREKGGDFARIPTQRLNLQKVEHKSEEHLKRNAAGQVPTLRLPSGKCISESVTICQYLETAFPSSSPIKLFGTDPRIGALLSVHWRNNHPATGLITQRLGVQRFPDFGDECKAWYIDQLKWLDALFKAKRETFPAPTEVYVADFDPLTATPEDLVGFSMVNIVLLVLDLEAVREWHGRVSQRPSVAVKNGAACKF